MRILWMPLINNTVLLDQLIFHSLNIQLKLKSWQPDTWIFLSIELNLISWQHRSWICLSIKANALWVSSADVNCCPKWTVNHNVYHPSSLHDYGVGNVISEHDTKFRVNLQNTWLFERNVTSYSRYIYGKLICVRAWCKSICFV